MTNSLFVLAISAFTAACGSEEPVVSSTLTAAQPISSPAAPGSAEPNLAVTADGAVILSWLEPAGDSAHALRFATLERGTWSPARTIASGGDWFVNWADYPSIVALPDGRLAAHWLQREGDGTGYQYGVRITQSADGGVTWTDPVRPHRDSAQAEHGFVSLFAAAGDSLGAVWLDGRKYDEGYGASSEMTLAYTTIAPNGALGVERLVDQRICDCCQTSAALTEAGPVVVYRDRTDDEIRDIYITRYVDGAWTSGEPVHRDGWEIAACPVNGPSVEASGNNVAVAWFTGAQDTARVRVAFSGDGGQSFGPPTRVDAGDPAGRVDVELLEDGSALVTWIERTGGEGAEVRVRKVHPDGTLGEAQTVAVSSGARASGFPQMVRSGDRVIFAWTEPGDPSHVRVASASVDGES
ncbi:MAG TPA: sialidase family protein [Longimicrobiaceae bacterium]|nr:sialidase family protein [Longimicrobiaceae bacterium]